MHKRLSVDTMANKISAKTICGKHGEQASMSPTDSVVSPALGDVGFQFERGRSIDAFRNVASNAIAKARETKSAAPIRDALKNQPRASIVDYWDVGRMFDVIREIEGT
jgi:hypothetical protein